jgi:ATP-dependent Clp protease ATP-binding subunit ClpA
MIDHLARIGYDPAMGARPLSRKIDEIIKVPLSKKILFEKLENCNITVDWSNDSLTVHTELSEESQVVQSEA